MVGSGDGSNDLENVIDKFDDSVDEFITDGDLLNRIVNGDENEVVTVGSGNVRSVAKLISDMETQINAAGDSWLNRAETAATTATNKLDEFNSIYHGASDTAPTTDVSAGDLWYDSANDLLKIRSATNVWRAFEPHSGAVFHGSSATEPETPSVGDLWYDSDNNRLMTYDSSGEWQGASYDEATAVVNVDGVLTSSTGDGLGNIVSANKYYDSQDYRITGLGEHHVFTTPEYTKKSGSVLMFNFHLPLYIDSEAMAYPQIKFEISFDSGATWTQHYYRNVIPADTNVIPPPGGITLRDGYRNTVQILYGSMLLNTQAVIDATKYQYKLSSSVRTEIDIVDIGRDGLGYTIENNESKIFVITYELGI